MNWLDSNRRQSSQQMKSGSEKPMPMTNSSQTICNKNDVKNGIAIISKDAPNSQYSYNLLNYMRKRMFGNPVQRVQFPFMRAVSNYEKVMKIGHGTFGEVFKAKCKEEQQVFAIKNFRVDDTSEGFPLTAIREVKMLKKLKSDHVIEFIEICNNNNLKFQDKSSFYLVLAFCDYDLAGLLSNKKTKLDLADIKCMMKQLFTGLSAIHKVGILHRDLKSANILINSEGILKLADFGLSRYLKNHNKPVNYTNVVVTLWYRSPELLLGSRRYGPGIDMWSAGCIMAELWTRTPIFKGHIEQRQLQLIQELCGGINKNVWPNVDQFPYFSKLTLLPNSPRVLNNKMLPIIQNGAALKLLGRLLTLDPSKRISAENALNDDFFFSNPLPRQNIKEALKELPKNMFEFTIKPEDQSAKKSNKRPYPIETLNPMDTQIY